MSRAKLFAAAFLLLVVATIAAVIWSTGDARRVVLPDGSMVEFLGATVGGETFTTEKRWHKLAKHLVPSRFSNWFPPVNAGRV